MAVVVTNPPADAGDARDVGSSPGSGRSLGGGHGNPIQYSCLVTMQSTSVIPILLNRELRVKTVFTVEKLLVANTSSTLLVLELANSE